MAPSRVQQGHFAVLHRQDRWRVKPAGRGVHWRKELPFTSRPSARVPERVPPAKDHQGIRPDLQPGRRPPGRSGTTSAPLRATGRRAFASSTAASQLPKGAADQVRNDFRSVRTENTTPGLQLAHASWTVISMMPFWTQTPAAWPPIEMGCMRSSGLPWWPARMPMPRTARQRRAAKRMPARLTNLPSPQTG